MRAQSESHNNGSGEIAGPKTKDFLSAKEFWGLSRGSLLVSVLDRRMHMIRSQGSLESPQPIFQHTLRSG
jgi:hypothetical protein